MTQRSPFLLPPVLYSAEPVTIDQFHDLMDHVVTTVRFGPRNYLAPHVRLALPRHATPHNATRR